MATRGRASCSIKDEGEDRDFVKTGPDGAAWALLGDADGVKQFCAQHPKLYHQRLAEHSAKHVCALHGTWGFTADGRTSSVVFLRYEFKGKLAEQAPDEVFDPATTVGIFGHDLYKEYLKVLRRRGYANVWQRDAHGEIALDFCIG